jgi:two-component system LytT family sensor kinase
LKTQSSQTFKRLVETIYSNRNYQFWLMQLVGWGGLSVVTFFSLTLWYNTVQWSYISHTVLQSVLGMLLSLPMHRAYLAIWDRPIAWRIGMSVLVVIVVSIFWTVFRMVTFIWMTDEQQIWADFGGWYFSSFLVYLCWAAFYYGDKYYYQAGLEQRNKLAAIAKIKEEQLKRLSAEADARQSQLGMLRYQLNPHFLFNTLNAISALVKFEESDKAHKMITQLGEFLRYSLDSDPAAMITFEQEIDALMLYLDIERTRFGERLTLQFDIAEQAKRARVPSLLLQPLLENAVKYAIAVNENGGTIGLSATVENDELVIELTDTGPGTVTHKPSAKTGRRVGLRNTLERLKTLYNDAYVFDISLRSGGGLRTNIRIPYNTD